MGLAQTAAYAFGMSVLGLIPLTAIGISVWPTAVIPKFPLSKIVVDMSRAEALRGQCKRRVRWCFTIIAIVEVAFVILKLLGDWRT